MTNFLVVCDKVGFHEAGLGKSSCTFGARVALHAPHVVEVAFHRLDQATAQLALQAGNEDVSFESSAKQPSKTD